MIGHRMTAMRSVIAQQYSSTAFSFRFHPHMEEFGAFKQILRFHILTSIKLLKSHIA
jgi:hypothetical protein